MDNREKRLMRVHRRSLDQREMRHEEVNKRRQIDDMSPVVESHEGSKNPSRSITPGKVFLCWKYVIISEVSFLLRYGQYHDSAFACCCKMAALMLVCPLPFCLPWERMKCGRRKWMETKLIWQIKSDR